MPTGPEGSQSPPSTSTSLLRRVIHGDQHAWEHFVHVYSGLIYSRCRRRNVPSQDTADVLQEVFRRVHRMIPQFRRDEPGQGFRHWLRVIARNVINDYLRGLATQPLPLDQTDHLSADLNLLATSVSEASGMVHRSEASLVVRNTLEVIQIDYEHRTWQAFWKTVVDGKPAVDVAKELGMAPGTVRQARYKILRRLRTELAQLAEDSDMINTKDPEIE